jgi:CRISPR-associated protein Cas1
MIMRKIKNVLYITSPHAYIACEDECLKICIADKPNIKIPAHNLEGIVQFGYPGASPAAMALCAKLSISMTFLTHHGRFLARVEGPQSGNILLRRQQYEIYFKGKSVNLSTRFIAAKIYNCRQVLSRGYRDYKELIGKDLCGDISKLSRLVNTAFHCTEEKALRGIEGDAAREYFKALNHLILVDKDNFYIKGRNKRPPLDNMNSLLSYLYVLLTHECRSACETVGLDPSAGFFHKDRPGRPSLALDIMEEFRPIFSDRLALSLINRKQLLSSDFEQLPHGEVRITDDAKRKIIDAWQQRKYSIISHPFLRKKIEFGLLPYSQSLLLAKHIRGDLEDYPAFLWK